MMNALADDAQDTEAIMTDLHDAQQARDLRDRAGALLDSLQRAKAECETSLAKFKRSDAMKTVTGRSALDRAIEQTRRTLDLLNQALAEPDGRPVRIEARLNDGRPGPSAAGR